LQAGGHRFDPGQLHQNKRWEAGSRRTKKELLNVEGQRDLILNIEQQEASPELEVLHGSQGKGKMRCSKAAQCGARRKPGSMFDN
jgi:hypothetical protein